MTRPPRAFPPRPQDLATRSDGVKITIALSRRSVNFFKKAARRHRTPYQRMIRGLLDAYAAHHGKAPARRAPARRHRKIVRRRAK
jgi:hypothetical protein